MSGSCNMKTCQRELPEFRVIGDALHMKYDNAVRVKMQMKDALNILNIVKKKRNGEYRRDNGGKLRSTHKKASINTMVYLKDSPDYCFKTHDFPGTQGRICSTDAFVANSCTELCCGRGYRSIQVVTRQRCKCKFHWCCEIRCKECENEETKNMCRWTLLLEEDKYKILKHDMSDNYDLKCDVQAHLNTCISCCRKLKGSQTRLWVQILQNACIFLVLAVVKRLSTIFIYEWTNLRGMNRFGIHRACLALRFAWIRWTTPLIYGSFLTEKSALPFPVDKDFD